VTQVHVIQPADLGPGELTSWHQMQKATPYLAHPFLSSEYAMAVGRFRPQSRVAVLMDGQSVTGFFPFEERRFGVGVPISGWLSACQGMIHDPDAEWDPDDLLRGCGLAAWRFDNLISGQAPFRPYLADVDLAPIIDLSGGFGPYHAEVLERAPRLCRSLGGKRARSTVRPEHCI
jgi:hypothetical protein